MNSTNVKSENFPEIKLENVDESIDHIASGNHGEESRRSHVPLGNLTSFSGRLAGFRASKRENDDGDSAITSKKRPFAPAKKIVKKSNAHMRVSALRTRPNFRRADLIAMQRISTLIRIAKRTASEGDDMSDTFFNIRQRLHQTSFFDFISSAIITQSKILDDTVLPAIMHNQIKGVDFPFDIRADATALYDKWVSGNYDPHLLRGLTSKKRENDQDKVYRTHRLDNAYMFRRTCNVSGYNSLVNGQWWPLQICALRDGAHGEMEAGIHGQTNVGAYSIVLSGSGYHNVDCGEDIKYCGTSGSKDSPTANTKLMIKSHESQLPIRVLRSSGLPMANRYRPTKGLRFDGLYTIDSFEILDADTAMYRFKLSRSEDQDPIRYEGPGVRPHEVELEELGKVKDMV